MEKKGDTITTTIRVRPEIWRALRSLAEARAVKVGGRPSVSALIAEMAERAQAARAQRAQEPRG